VTGSFLYALPSKATRIHPGMTGRTRIVQQLPLLRSGQRVAPSKAEGLGFRAAGHDLRPIRSSPNHSDAGLDLVDRLLKGIIEQTQDEVIDVPKERTK
jgi:hypothetical protein